MNFLCATPSQGPEESQSEAVGTGSGPGKLTLK